MAFQKIAKRAFSRAKKVTKKKANIKKHKFLFFKKDGYFFQTLFLILFFTFFLKL